MESNSGLGNISFDLPKNQSNVIKVIGVGGGGSNAINHMFQQGINGVDFIICNTDAQALANSPVPNKIQLGLSLTEGLGAGANPEVGQQSALESIEEIEKMLDTNTKLVFITAGMGGGTGTGAAPVIAQLAKERDILTVGIVTIPFQFEGKVRHEQALAGVDRLRKQVDSLIVINNNKLREVYGNLGFKAGFAKADEVLSTASKGIAEVITHHYTQNIDLKDAKTVLSNSGTAIMGSSKASGENRAKEAIVSALDSPLLNDNKITGAKNVLLLIVCGENEITIDEISEINEHIQAEAGHNANIIMGVGDDETLGDSISVTIIATGFDIEQQGNLVNQEQSKIIHTLDSEQSFTSNLSHNPNVKMPENFTQIQRPNTIQNTAMPVQPQTERIVHNLDEEVEYTEKKQIAEIENTSISQSINNFDTFFEIVSPEPATRNVTQFVIEDAKPQTQVNVAPPVQAPVVENFEEPANRVVFNLDNTAPVAQVAESTFVAPEPIIDAQGKKIYSLDDYMEKEEELTASKPVEKVVEEPELNMTVRTINQPQPVQAPVQAPVRNVEMPAEDVLQTSSIEETLRLRSQARKDKMKAFNHKFTGNKHADLDSKPAYERMGIDIHSTPMDNSRSRMSVGFNNDEVQLRNNNSFLHDNVD